MKKQYWILMILIVATLVISACSAPQPTVTVEPAEEDTQLAAADEPMEDAADQAAEAIEPEEAEEPEEMVEAVEYGSVAVFEVIHRNEDKKVADVCGSHWHGMLPLLQEGDRISLGAFLEDEFGEEIVLDGDHYALSAAVDEGAAEEMVSFVFHGDHLYVIGEAAGETRVVFKVLQDGEVIYQTPSMAVYVD